MPRAKKLSPEKLAKFRHDIAALNRAKLIPGAKVNAKSAKPSQTRGGKSLKTLIKQYRDVIEGRASAIKMSKTELAEQRRAGRKITDGRAHIPKQKDETVRRGKGGAIKIVHRPSGMRRIDVPHKKGESTEAWIKRAIKIAEKNRQGAYLGYQVKGHHGARYFSGENAADLLQMALEDSYSDDDSLADVLEILDFDNSSDY